MKRFLAVMGAGLLALWGVGLPADPPPGVDASALVRDNNLFAVALFGNLSSPDRSSNLFFSPFSVSTALGMTYAGARGETAVEMARTLHFNANPSSLYPEFSVLLDSTDATGKPYQLKIADALWRRKGLHFQAGFMSLISKAFRGGFKTVDFAGNPEKSRQIINAWVENHTADKIVDLLHQEDIDKRTALVLTNAIYFKSKWAFKIDKNDTTMSPFHVDPKTAIQAQMMHVTGKFGYSENDSAQALQLPYSGDDLYLLVVLPRNSDNPTYQIPRIADWTGSLPMRSVHVTLPKFKINYRSDLKVILSKMGMPRAFSGAADFSGMTGDKSLEISAVIHQAFIEADEEGSEAAAATAVVMKPKRVHKTFDFNADHPFIFAIVHRTTGSILFMGQVSQPSL